jgi:cis-3-alkyl-4-acyloxetan-2-one decarboxylase
MNYPDYPFTGRHKVIEGLRIHYLDEGNKAAAPVIMLHGNPSWSYYFRKLAMVLRVRHRCIVPDHIGMGLSEKPSEDKYDFSLDRRVDDLAALLDQLDIKENLTLVLHDWGGMIGMAYAMRYPDRIKRLVILNTAAFHLPGNKSIPWQLVLSRIPFINALLNQGMNAFCLGAIKYCVKRSLMSEEVASAYAAPYNSWQNRLAVRKFVEDIPLRPGDKAYNTVDTVNKELERFSDLPMLICWGLKDFVFDEDFLDEWQKRFPFAEVHCFEDAGHYILEDAAEDVIPLINKFLNNHPL